MRKVLTWDLPLSVLAAFTLTYGATFLFIIPFDAPGVFLAVIGCCLFFALAAAYARYVVRALPFLLILAPVFWLYDWHEPMLELLNDYIKWIWNAGDNPGFERLSSMLIALAISAPVFILIRCRSPAPVLLLVGGTLFYGIEMGAGSYPRWLVWGFMFSVLLQMAHTAEPPLQWDEEEEAAEKRARRALPPLLGMRLLAALPACLIAVLAAGILVTPDADPFRFFREMNITGFIGGSGGPGSGGRLLATQITNVGRDLGGPFRPAGQLMLTLRSEAYTVEGPYLRGGVGVEYDGRRWVGDGFEGLDLETGALTEIPAVVQTYGITYETLRGTRLYLPYGTALLSGGRPEEALPGSPVWFTGDVLRLRDDPGAGLSYTAMAADKGDAPPLYRSWDTNLPEDAPEDFRRLPSDLPARVITLARSLAVYGDGYYNALSIERYLLEGFAYNADMPSAPANRDFVEYFLFEAREGYCTYFATAMAVLCRAAGLPARYAEGFAPSDEQEGRDFLYTDERAHAWVEVWLEGQGWTRFEPTPGYNRMEEVIFPERVRPETPYPSPDMPSPPPSPQNPSVLPSPSPDGAGAGGTGRGSQVPWLSILRYLLPPLTLYGAWLVMRIRRKRFDRMLAAIPYSQKTVRRIYRRLLWLVSHAEVTPKPEETLNEFADRADEAWPTKLYIMRRVADVYGKSCYADEPLTPEESGTLRHYVEVLERRAHIHLGGTRYWLYSKILSLLPVERKTNDGFDTFEQ
ncbi:MAG: transglutaminase domain-containing protein [Oscillospiraceae bacterium]|nr:transglutaminase domain-containing protein [Oscillospiraceae bacterium]